MKHKSKQFTIQDLVKEVEALIPESNREKTKAELSDWLIRLYEVTGKIVLVEKAYSQHPVTNESKVVINQFMKEFPNYIHWLHGMMDAAITEMEEKFNGRENDR